MVNQYDEDFYKVIEEAVDFAWNPMPAPASKRHLELWR